MSTVWEKNFVQNFLFKYFVTKATKIIADGMYLIYSNNGDIQKKGLHNLGVSRLQKYRNTLDDITGHLETTTRPWEIQGL